MEKMKSENIWSTNVKKALLQTRAKQAFQLSVNQDILLFSRNGILATSDVKKKKQPAK